MTQHYIEVVTWNKKMMEMYGDTLTPTQKAIGMRSNGLHTEIHFSGRYGGIWWSCTMADGVGGCRFKAINRSHPYRQSIIRIYVTAEQEARLFAKACEMADMEQMKSWTYENLFGSALWRKDMAETGHCYYGPDHIKYDKWGAMFAFLTKWKIVPMHEVRMICNEAVAEVMLVVWPDLLVIDQEYHEAKADIGSIAPTIFIESYNNADPATLTPDQFEYQVRHYFENTDRPNQQDINNIIREVNDDNPQEQETPAEEPA